MKHHGLFGKITLAVIVCVSTILPLCACFGFKLPMTDTSRATQVTTQKTEASGSVFLQINEFKFGYSEAGEPLPDQNRTREFTLVKDGKIYEGLPDKANEYTRCILTLTDISDKAVTVTILDNGQEVIRDINYNTEFTYTAFTNPDEYSYEYTIIFVK